MVSVLSPSAKFGVTYTAEHVQHSGKVARSLRELDGTLRQCDKIFPPLASSFA